MQPPWDGKLSPGDVAHLLNDKPKKDCLAPLSKRDREVFGLILEGVSEMGMGVRLGIQARSVRQMRSKMQRKLGTRDLLEFAREHGLK